MRKLSIAILISLLAVLVAAISGCEPGTSSAGNSSPSPATKTGAPAKLVFIMQPGGAIAGSALSTQPVVAITDSNGNTVTGSTLPIKLTLTSSTGESGAALLGPSTKNAVSGVARFSDLFFDKAGTGYSITATSSNLTPATSNSFDVSPGAASKLVFTAQPSGGIAGMPFKTQPGVVVEDYYGNTVTGYEGSVTMGLVPGTIELHSGSSGAILSGTTSVKVIRGVATFSDISLNRTGTGYRLSATGSGLIPSTSDTFDITSGTAVKLAFAIQPSDATVKTAFKLQPVVWVEDINGNICESSGSAPPVTISITSGTGTKGAVLSGTTTINAVSNGYGPPIYGVAAFTGLSINLAGSGYELTATSNGLTSVTSDAFNVAASTP